MAFKKPLHPSSSLHTPPYRVLGLSIHSICMLAGSTVPSGSVVPTALYQPTTKRESFPGQTPGPSSCQALTGTAEATATKRKKGRRNCDGLGKENNRQTQNKKRKITRYIFFQSLVGYVSPLMAKPSEAGREVCSLKNSCYNSSWD